MFLFEVADCDVASFFYKSKTTPAIFFIFYTNRIKYVLFIAVIKNNIHNQISAWKLCKTIIESIYISLDVDVRNDQICTSSDFPI